MWKLVNGRDEQDSSHDQCELGAPLPATEGVPEQVATYGQINGGQHEREPHREQLAIGCSGWAPTCRCSACAQTRIPHKPSRRDRRFGPRRGASVPRRRGGAGSSGGSGGGAVPKVLEELGAAVLALADPVLVLGLQEVAQCDGAATAAEGQKALHVRPSAQTTGRSPGRRHPRWGPRRRRR